MSRETDPKNPANEAVARAVEALGPISETAQSIEFNQKREITDLGGGQRRLGRGHTTVTVEYVLPSGYWEGDEFVFDKPPIAGTPRGMISAEDARFTIYSDPFARAARDDLAQREALMNRLWQHRQRLALTQAQVAKRMRTTEMEVVELETIVADPHVSVLQRYASAVGQRLELRLVEGDS